MKRLRIIEMAALLSMLIFIGSCSKEVNEVDDRVGSKILAVKDSRGSNQKTSALTAIGVGYNIYQELLIDKIPWVSGGDADVYSRSGRSTKITINIDNLRVADDGSGVTIHVLYQITEPVSNYTCLRIDSDYFIPCTRKIMAVLPVYDFIMNNYSYSGQNWNWNIMNGSGCIATTVSFKFDGPGNDDNGNAQLKLFINIPVLVES
jgi:hypothetical protein